MKVYLYTNNKMSLVTPYFQDILIQSCITIFKLILTLLENLKANFIYRVCKQ